MSVSHNYGTDDFLLQYKYYVAVGGPPLKIYCDLGLQLMSTRNYVTWTEAEAPSNWDWRQVKEEWARNGMVWMFMPTEGQFRNGLAKSHMKASKPTLKHVLTSTLINSKLTLSYVELQTVLARAANIVNA